jgi:plasmid replication initiation protein
MTLNELSKRKVVEHNSLITSIAKMDKTPFKMFELAVSCINTEEPPKNNTVYLSKEELFAFLKWTTAINTVVLKKRLKKCKNKPFFKIKEKKEMDLSLKISSPFPMWKWTDYHDEVTIRFILRLCLI